MTIRLAASDARALESHCRRQLRWDRDASARLVTAISAIGVFTRPPMEVLVFAAVPTQEPVAPDDALDQITSLGALADLLASGDEDGVVIDRLPRIAPHLSAMPRLDELPPREGWQLPITGVAGDQVPVVDRATKEFEARAAGLPQKGQQEVAEEIWSRPSFGGLPLRALHAARQLGMLADDRARIATATNGPWKRLSTTRGQVFAYASGPAARLSLHVVR
ncbi:MAG: hypothetical protein GC156_14470 [Actinomycetales bacterium]|nr:hypothetical protein [Actinomycetales bacterium]